MKKLFRMSVSVFLVDVLILVSAWAGPVRQIGEWRWGNSSIPVAFTSSKPIAASLFDQDKKWGAKEWLIVGAVVAAVVVVVAVASSGGHGGSGGGGGGY